MPRVLVQTDNFNRELLGADWAQQNTAAAGNIVINALTQATGQFSALATDQLAAVRWAGAGSFLNNQYSEIRFSNVAAGSGANFRAGATVRSSGSGSTRAYYEFVVAQTLPTGMLTELAVWTSGTSRTVLHSATVAWANNDLLGLEIDGTTLTATRNGVALGGGFTRNDTALSTGVPGLTATASSLIQDWEGGNITAGGDTTPPVITGPGGATGSTASATVTAPATAVHTYTANEAVTWSLNGGANVGLFTINASTGALAFSASSTAGTYVVGVRATDTAGNATTQTLTVTVSATATFSVSFPDGVLTDITGASRRLSQAWTGYAIPWNPATPAAAATATRTVVSGTTAPDGALAVTGLPAAGLVQVRAFFGSGASVAVYTLVGTAA